ncbi:proteasome adapter and scaffold protein ECM29 [Planococcus citri]|uniref:proteasome adapter and scaffold protein ECM29 n=1 Tax=Planococcus citri TaxID=170843 RepID=UPI0031F90CB1
MTSEAEDLMLLERAFLRIGSTENDKQFEALIDKLLGPIIFKVPSHHDSVRKKAIELLTHISKRIKCRPEVQVPVETLLKYYVEVSKDQFVKNFLVVYVKLGYHRMSPEKQVENIPILLQCIEDPKTTDQLRNSLLNLLVRSCKYFVDSDTAKQFVAANDVKTWKSLPVLLEIFSDVLVLPYSLDVYSNNNALPPCMSCYSFKRITQDGKIDDLAQIKLGILQLLDTSDLKPEDIYLSYVIASIDLHGDVSSVGKQQLKKTEGSFEWTDSVLRPLYKLFVGDNDKVVDEKRKRPADLRIKLKLLPYLQRINHYCWPECIQVVVSCIEEDTNPGIKLSGLNFGLMALQKTELHSFKEVAPNFLNILTEMLWKKEKDTATRNTIYKLAGNVISLNPELVKYHKEIFPKFIEDLTEETSSEMRNTIKDSLLKMAYAFKETEEPDSLMHFLANRITSPEPLVKHVVMHYLHKVFAPDHVNSRFLLMWLSADCNVKMREEADNLLYEHLKSLKENKPDKITSRQMPEFSEMLNYVYKGCCPGESGLQTKFKFGDQNLVLHQFNYVKILVHLRACLLYECYWPLCITKFDHPCSYSPRIGQFLRNLYATERNTLEYYMEFITRVMLYANYVEPLKCLLEIVGTVPDLFSIMFVKHSQTLQNYMFDKNEELSIVATEIYGIVFAYTSIPPEIKPKIDEFFKYIESSQDEKQCCASMRVIGCLAERGLFHKTKSVPLNLVELIAERINSKSNTIALTACESIGRIGRVHDLPLPNRNLKDPVKYGDFDGLRVNNENEKPDSEKSTNKQEDNADESTAQMTKLKLVEKLLDLATEKEVPHKLKMKAAQTLGLLCVGEEEFPYRKLIIVTILNKLRDDKIIGTLLDFGDVLSDCIMGSYSIRSLDLWNHKESEFKLPKNWNHAKAKELFLFTVRKIKSDMVEDTKCKSKTAGAVWMLILMKRCIKLPLDLNDLTEIQSIFLDLIALNDETVHDAATRGLSFIPRFVDDESTNILAKQLIDKIYNVNKSTSEIGNVLGMYKEFCYLVTSLKNSGMIYHFLNLLNRDNQKSDDKYSAQFKDHEEASVGELRPYFPQIVSSLYFYRFHPSPKIKQAMSVIWSTLFPENVKTVQAHSKSILQKAIPELTRPALELRIAYCLALEDVLRIEGNKFVSENKELMPELLTNLYKLMDDIYDSVKRTAYGTTKAYLQAFVQNILYHKKSSDSENELLNLIFPVLLNQGVSSNVLEVQAVSVKVLQDIIDHVGTLIKSHLHYLIPKILENASEIDVSVINKYAVRFADDAQTTEKIETFKEQFVSNHFSTTTIRGCIRYMDEDVIEKLLPRLLELLKDNISYSTRMAAINFVITLANTMDVPKLQPFVGKLLGALLTGVSNNHKTVRKNSATAIGNLCKAAKDSSIDNLLSKLVNIYTKTQDENIKSAVGQTLLAISAQNQEAIQIRAEKIVPIIFFAMHLKKLPDGSNDGFIELWNEVWNDVIGSMEVTLTKHKTPVLKLLIESFNSPAWSTKTQVARSLSTFVNKYPDSLQDCEEIKSITKEIIATLQAKFWHGKEDLLETAAALCSKERILDEALQIEVIETVLKECSRGNIAYKTIALESLGKILMVSNHDYFAQVYENVKHIISDNFEESATANLDKEESASVSNQCLKLKETAYFVLGKAWPNDARTQSTYQEEIVQLLTDCLMKNTRITQVSVMVALKNLISKLNIIKKSSLTPEEEITLNSVMVNIEKSIQYAIELKKHTLLKKEALHVMINLMEQFNESGNRACLKRIVDLFTDHVNDLTKDPDPIISLQTSQLKELLKRISQS